MSKSELSNAGIAKNTEVDTGVFYVLDGPGITGMEPNSLELMAAYEKEGGTFLRMSTFHDDVIK